MDILTQIVDSKETFDFKTIFNNILNEMVNPTVFNPSALFYGSFTDSIGKYIYSKIRDAYSLTFKLMDDYFYNSKGRRQRYYVKAYRKRTIITIFGKVEFKRHEYIDRSTNKPFIYVDEKIGLHRKDRYDPCVCSKIYERYSYNNSMEKAGIDVGVNLYSPFDTSESRLLNSIPRQTIWKILHRFKEIQLPNIEKQTPKYLYVMADEKYIPGQNNEEKGKLMCKEVIVHEGIRQKNSINKQTGEVTNRNSLINPHRIITYDEDIYSKTMNYIFETYNTDKINTVYLMGDGGSWIKDGLISLHGYSYKVKYGLDRFHFCTAINSISKDNDIKAQLYEYSISNKVKQFKELVEKIKRQNEDRKETIIEKSQYILNNLIPIKTMYKEIKIGCAMEQAISHDIASQFTSVPKAYSKKWLPFYLNQRQNYLNKYDLIKIYLEASDKTLYNKEENTVALKEHLNLSFFDNQIKDETYKLAKSANLAYIRKN